MYKIVMGAVIGILPGAGAAIAAFLCYAMEQKLSKRPEKFGAGCLEGIAAPETGNNAATGGSMGLLLSLGIPGGNTAAIMMSALLLKGVTMGPLLLIKQPQFLSATFASMPVSNIIMMATIGAFAAKNTAIDVSLMAISGLFGFVFVVCKLNSSTLILGLVLGTICESNLLRAILWSELRETKPCSR
jgi:putative tricarboxylic transport membrane protein